MRDEYTYDWLMGRSVDGDTLQTCADLFSGHYGTWSDAAPHGGGGRIRLSAKRLRAWLNCEDANLFCARFSDKIIGYAIASRVSLTGKGVISWVTQLVVHSEHRKNGVAKRLLFSIWGMTDHYAWGLVSSNPYAIRALEKATRRRCSPGWMRRNQKLLRTVGARCTTYIREDVEFDLSKSTAAAYTAFYVNHSNLPDKLKAVATEETPWVLGDLKEGWEWLAFVFRDQTPLRMSYGEIEEMMLASDQVAQSAYARSPLTPRHRWAKGAEREVEHILSRARPANGAVVHDFGCGAGRHALALAGRGFRVTGVDYVGRFVADAREKAEKLGLTAEFIEGDCRTVAMGDRAELALCLYDVVGSHAERAENSRILEDIARNLVPGGHLALSVMNYELTLFRAVHKFRLSENPSFLLSLPPSRIMEDTGDVFNPEFYAVDTETQVVYRKEQFTAPGGAGLPTELLVRDRRFRLAEISELCAECGFEVLSADYVSAKDWGAPLDPTADGAKEILLFCRKRLQ